VLALTAGTFLDEHENPGEATIQVLSGRIRLTAGEVAWEGRSGDLLVVPEARHALHAVEDSAILLTVSKAAQPARP
jgi:quercetin dioxygenase-like cupin family protein